MATNLFQRIKRKRAKSEVAATAEEGKAGWGRFMPPAMPPKTYTLLITGHDMPGLSGLTLVRGACRPHGAAGNRGQAAE